MSALIFDPWAALEKMRREQAMQEQVMQARSADGGGGSVNPMDQAEREHRDNIELGRLEQFTETMTITPAYARMVLERFAPDGSNRRLRMNDVRNLSADLRAGLWDNRTHQGIAFDIEGNLNDGQHRLHACVAANVPITLPVTFGQPREVFVVLDQHTPRKTADMLTVARAGLTNSIDGAATARVLVLLRRGAGGGRLSKRSVMEHAAANADEINVAVRLAGNVAVSLKGGFSRASLAAAAFLMRAACRDHNAVDVFFDLLRTGAGLEARSPVLLLRDGLKTGAFLTNNPQGEVRIKMTVGAVVNAWNLWRGRRGTTSVKALTWTPEKEFPAARS